MAHECPDCAYTCYCNGDRTDRLVNDSEAIADCTHCQPLSMWSNPDFEEARDKEEL